MILQSACKISKFIVEWLDENNCLLGFTITYQDGTIENNLRKCTIANYESSMIELKQIWETYMQNNKLKNQNKTKTWRNR